MSAERDATAVRVLVVCDTDVECRLPAVFASEGWETVAARVGEVLDQATDHEPDLVVFYDLAIYVATRACAVIHATGRVPVVAMSPSLRENDVVAGLKAGIDSFVPEAIGDRELIARARALLRRYVPRARARVAQGDESLVAPPVVLDPASRLVLVDGEPVAMPRREFDILELLMRGAPRTVTRALLLRELWVTTPDSQTLDVQVRRLRARLAAACGGAQLIVTVRGVGYRFVTSEPVRAPDAPVEIDLRAPAPGTVDVVAGSSSEPDDDAVRGSSGWCGR